jgi:hypothetical protein
MDIIENHIIQNFFYLDRESLYRMPSFPSVSSWYYVISFYVGSLLFGRGSVWRLKILLYLHVCKGLILPFFEDIITE